MSPPPPLGATDAAGTRVELGDERAFERLTQRHRRELHVHCYRMLASFDEAEDAVQETFLRAWRARDDFGGDQQVRAWLYRIATNVCLDALRRRGRRPVDLRSNADIAWLQPYPDPLLDEIEPGDAAVQRETIELAFLAALQVLPARQRAALLLRDVLGMTAAETADQLGTSVPAANSALQRARATLQQHLPSHRSEWSIRSVAGRKAGTAGAVGAVELSAEDRDLLARFIDAHERHDTDAALAAATADIRITMPPHPFLYEGIDGIRPLLHQAFTDSEVGAWRLLPTSLNRMPAAASYLRRPGDTEHRAFKFDVLRVEGGRIAEITTFGPDLFAACGLPDILPS
ncbi:MAG TPA: RNA polymerase subunit sigma-70 [Acidimicrobiales bacterium]